MELTTVFLVVLALGLQSVNANSVDVVSTTISPTTYTQPQITAPPRTYNWDLKRQASNGTAKTCGYVNQMADWPLTCYANQACFTQAQYFACCDSPLTTYTTSAAQLYTSYDQCYYWRGCYDSTASAQCTGNCTSTAFICTSSEFPYCGTATWPYTWIGSTYTGSYYFCHSERYTLAASFGTNTPSSKSVVASGPTRVSGAGGITSTESESGSATSVTRDSVQPSATSSATSASSSVAASRASQSVVVPFFMFGALAFMAVAMML